MKALVPISRCPECPHFKETPYPTSDSFERPSYWWCLNPNVEEAEEVNEGDSPHYNMLKRSYEKVRKIQGYVEWHEEKHIKIPEFCPLTKQK